MSMKLHDILEAEEALTQDFIITRYEVGQISYQDAWKKILKITPKRDLPFWEEELRMAMEYKGDIPEPGTTIH